MGASGLYHIMDFTEAMQLAVVNYTHGSNYTQLHKRNAVRYAETT